MVSYTLANKWCEAVAMPKTEDAVDIFTKLLELRVLKITSVLVSDCIF